MNIMQDTTEYYTPDNLLQKKTGVGGLPKTVIDKAQAMADAITIDFRPFASNKILTMKQQLNSDDFISAQNDNSIDDFLFHLIPFDINAKLTKNLALAGVSDHLLKFVEGLSNFNIDSHHVIKAHVSAMDILTKKNISDPKDGVVTMLMTELADVCRRYYLKHGHKNQKVTFIDG
jgi:hypothetical protein